MEKEEQIKINQEAGLDFDGCAISQGNDKLPKTDIIFNMTSAQDCPSASRNKCAVRDYCYACRDERLYKRVKEKHIKMQEWFLGNYKTNPERIKKLIGQYTLSYTFRKDGKRRKNAPKRMRINEAGDFTDKESAALMNEIAGELRDRYGVNVTYCWTANDELDGNDYPNLIINASNFRVKGAQRVFLAVDKKWLEKHVLKEGEYICPGKNGCRKCSVCAELYTNNRIHLVFVVKH